jgi:hypothetical protein
MHEIMNGWQSLLFSGRHRIIMTAYMKTSKDIADIMIK